MKKIKIMFFLFSLGHGGVQRFVLNLVKNLNKEQYDITIVLVNKRGINLKHVPNEVKVIDLKAGRVHFSLIPVIRILKKERPDILFSIDTTINIVAILAKVISKSSCKLIIRQAVELNEFSTSRFTLKLAKLLYPKVDKCVVLTNTMKVNINNTLGMKTNKMQVIYNSIDIQNIDSKKVENIKGKIIKINHPRIIAVGRLTKQKNYPMLLDAIKEVLKNHKATLFILGEGEDRDIIQAQIKESKIEDHVVLLGFKENPYKYVYNSDVYVLSSIYEGLSNSLLEALACDIPIVTTDNPDNIIRDGINGFEVELSPKSIANGITRLLENDPLRKSIIKNNSEYKNQFGIDIMISKYEELFNEMLV